MRNRSGAPTARERALAYLSAFLDGDELERAAAETRRRCRILRTTSRTLRVAHTVLREHARVAPEAAAYTLVAAAELTPDDAAEIVGIDPARLRLLLSAEGVAVEGRRTSWVGARSARRDLLWPGVATVWLAVLALAIVPADGVARGPALLLAQPRSQLALSAVSAVRPPAVQPGGQLHVTVAVMNGGPDTAEDVNVKLLAPGDVSPVADRGTVTLSGVGDEDPQPLETSALLSGSGVSIGTVPAAATAQLDVRLQVAEGVEDGTEIGVSARVSVPSFGELGSSQARATVQRRPELNVDLSVSPSGTVAPGEQLTWSVQIRNVGTVEAGSVSVHGELPDSLRYVEGSALVDGSTPPAPTNGAGMGLKIGSVAPGGTRTASFDTVVGATAAGDVIAHRVRVAYAGADGPARSGTVHVDVVTDGELADTGLRMTPAAVLAAVLLVGGAALLNRTRQEVA